MRNVRQQRLRLYLEADGKCHYCDQKTVFPRGNILNNVPNCATIDHLYSKFHPDRNKPCHDGERRRVLSCYRCNQLRARLEEIVQHVGDDTFIKAGDKVVIERCSEKKTVPSSIG